MSLADTGTGAVSMIPGWNSIDAVAKWHRGFEIAGFVALGLLLLFEILAYVYGNRKDSLVAEQVQAERAQVQREAEIAAHAAQLHVEGRAGIEALLEDTRDPNPKVAEYAQATLRKKAAEFESKITDRELNSEPYKSMSAKKTMSLMHTVTSTASIALCFAHMKQIVGWNIPTLDIPAADRWCSENKQKCDD